MSEGNNFIKSTPIPAPAPTSSTPRSIKRTIATFTISLLALGLAILSYHSLPSLTGGRPIQPTIIRRFATLFKPSNASLKPIMTIQPESAGVKRGDVYFISHGGPPSVEQYHTGPYLGWRKFGELVKANRPKGIVAVSAHWQNDEVFSRGGVLINSDQSNPLIYDFYNFPKRFYELTFSSSGDERLKSSVLSELKGDGISVKEEGRGLDHGIWVPFKAAFGDSLDIPLIQVSLPASNDPLATAKLGTALAPLRDEGFAIVATGQSVHNLRDIFGGRNMPYTRPFLDATKSAVSSPSPLEPALALMKNKDYKSAHPTDEHFLPLIVAAAAAAPEGKDKVEEIFCGIVDIGGNTIQGGDEGRGMGWGMWRWSAK